METKPVLIVEGEKCVYAAQKHFLNQYVVLTWSGGSNTYDRIRWKKQLDWHPPVVYLWPDKDIKGMKWAINGSVDHEPMWKTLRDLGHKVRIINPWDYDSLPSDGYDIADLLEVGGNPQVFIEHAVNPDSLVLADTYQRCAIARDHEIKIEELKEIKCGTKEECKSCSLNYINLISTPNDIQKYASALFMLDYCYLTQTEMFVQINKNQSYSTRAFSNKLKHIAVAIGEGKQSSTDIFLSHESTLKCEHRTFRPGESIICGEEGDTYLNHWNVAKLDSIPDLGFLSLWHDIVKHVIVNDEEREYFLDWLAFTIQFPEKKINHQILLISPVEGVGKDSILAPVAMYFKAHAQNVDPIQLKDKFTSFLEGTKFMMIQELSGRGKGNNHAQTLKPLAASQAMPMIRIERKGENPYDIPNVVSIVAMSNEDIPMYINDKDRRWYVIKSDAQKLDIDLAKKYYNLLFNGGIKHNYFYSKLPAGASAVIAWLRMRNLESFNYGGPAPMTVAKEELVKYSNPWEAQLQEMIDEGAKPFNKDIISSLELKYIAEQISGRTNLQVFIRQVQDILKPVVSKPSKNLCNIPASIRKQRSDGLKNITLYFVRNYDAWANKEPRDLVEAWHKGMTLPSNMYSISGDQDINE